jgi:hypothetical protein
MKIRHDKTTGKYRFLTKAEIEADHAKARSVIEGFLLLVVFFFIVTIGIVLPNHFQQRRVAEEAATATKKAEQQETLQREIATGKRAPSGERIECRGGYQYLVITGYRHQRIEYKDEAGAHRSC